MQIETVAFARVVNCSKGGKKPYHKLNMLAFPFYSLCYTYQRCVRVRRYGSIIFDIRRAHLSIFRHLFNSNHLLCFLSIPTHFLFLLLFYRLLSIVMEYSVIVRTRTYIFEATIKDYEKMIHNHRRNSRNPSASRLSPINLSPAQDDTSVPICSIHKVCIACTSASRKTHTDTGYGLRCYKKPIAIISQAK